MHQRNACPTPLTRAIGAAASLLGLGFGLGCSAQADIPEVVVTQSDIAFEGVPRIPGITDVSTTLSTSFDHPKGFELPEFFNPELHPLSASIEGRGGMQDLSFIEGLSLTLSSRGEGAPPSSVVASYERTSEGLVGRVVNMQTDNDSDVLSYWSTKAAYYDVTLWGVLPEDAWAIDVTVAFSGRISVSSSD